MYLEPWHADIIEFLDLKKNHGNEMERARDLFYAMWIPDLFMKRVEQNGTWYGSIIHTHSIKLTSIININSSFLSSTISMFQSNFFLKLILHQHPVPYEKSLTLVC